MPWLSPSPEKVRKLKKADQMRKCVQICWRDANGQIRKCSSGTKDYREARHILSSFNPDAPTGKEVSTESGARFSQIAAEYIRSKHLKESTVARYQALAKSFVGYAGDLLLGELTPAILDGFKTWCRDSTVEKVSTGRKVAGDQYADRTIAMGIILIKAVLKFAYGRGYISTDISTEIKPLPKSKIVQKDVRAYCDEELRLLFDADLHPNVIMCFRGLLMLGCRLGELANIRWEHVDLRQRTVRIYGQKTNRWRVVPISSSLLPHLVKLSEEGRASTNRVFRMEHGGPVTKHLYFHLARVRRQYGWRNVNLHSFRHSFIQNHLRAGVDFRTLMRWTGHSDVKSFAAYLSQYEPMRDDIDRACYDFLEAPGGTAL